MEKILKFKSVIIVIAFLMIVTNTVSASILGDTITNSSIKFGEGTYFNQNTYMSTQEGVGQQTENYIEYKPNPNIIPKLTDADAVQGTKSPSKAITSITNKGLTPVALINADYFSFKTGVPMSHTIMDGNLVTKDVTGQDAIGFNQDGSAFISWLEIDTVMNVNDQPYMYIDNINKYRLPYAPYLFSDYYGAKTNDEGKGLNVIIGSLSGPMKIGNTVSGVVENIINCDGSVDIPKGKLVLSIDENGFKDSYDKISKLKVGDKISITNTAKGEQDKWNNAVFGVGCTGGRLLKDGKLTDTDNAAAPRTAIGVKNDGSVIFYTIDGRQNGYSYGVRFQTLAKRLLELGCVDAVNLDGGGSTVFEGQYPGDGSMTLINKPSDGQMRSVSNFFYLENTQKPTGTLNEIYIYPYNKYYLSGASEQFSVKGVDSAFYKTDIKDSVTYSISSGQISNDGKATLIADENNKATVNATASGITGSLIVNVIKNPSKIFVKNEAGRDTVSSLKINVNSNINLTAESYLNYTKLESSDTSYTWKIENKSGEIGTINENGDFTASGKSAEGKIIVSAGNCKTEIPVEIIDPSETVTDKYFAKVETELKDKNLNIYISNPRDTTTDKTGIAIKADGSPVDFDYKNDTATVKFDTLPYKISISVQNSLGNTTLKNVALSEYDGINNFIDTQNHWAENILSYMNHCGVINGSQVGDKYAFRPNDNMTRAEFAVMLCNFLKDDTDMYADTVLPYQDLDTIPNWALKQVKTMYALGIMKGRSGEGDTIYFDTNAKITRSEVITAITRQMPQNIASTDLNFKDNDQIPSWALDSYKKLFANNIISGYEDGTIKPLDNITRAEAVKILYSIY